MKKIILFSMMLSFFTFSANAQLNPRNVLKDAKKAIPDNNNLTNEEVVSGLKEALTVGSNNATGLASKVDGYYKNPEIFIPFPEEAVQVKNTAERLGMQKQVYEFVMALNRAAEEAAKEAAPVFASAVKGMTVGDGFAILKGNDDAATVYLKDKTSAELYSLFLPIVKSAVEKVEVTKYWNPIITSYNRVPTVQKVNPDLDAYVTQKAMEGLFVLLAKEELKIRKDPAARVSDILRKVFGG